MSVILLTQDRGYGKLNTLGITKLVSFAGQDEYDIEQFGSRIHAGRGGKSGGAAARDWQ
ncbi:hypothetical protein PEC302110_33110 [Pectobacterium araliae]|uniref:Uncharacterized protein n=1 Tax=Pectobacterium araliae TaxID=3073862 RepID=A0AAN0KIG9_9GAMM|nr:hypothetical protein PEC302110_33110 [Pectobacterium sp. MAFF 302110]